MQRKGNRVMTASIVLLATALQVEAPFGKYEIQVPEFGAREFSVAEYGAMTLFSYVN